jgi:hypothetical protein
MNGKPKSIGRSQCIRRDSVGPQKKKKKMMMKKRNKTKKKEKTEKKKKKGKTGDIG